MQVIMASDSSHQAGSYLDQNLDSKLNDLLGKVEITAGLGETRKGTLEPIIEGTHLLCAGQDLTLIPESWGHKYGATVKYIDLSYNLLADIQGLELFQNLETLVLDNNELGDKISFPLIPTLKTLCLNNNNVQEIGSFLSKIAYCFPHLEYFSFLKNPACYNPLTGGSEEDYQRYRYKVIHALRKLKFLDSTPVTASERRASAALFETWDPITPSQSENFASASEESLLIPPIEAPSVVASETRHENKVLAKPFTVYQVTMVNAKGEKTSVYRRYNDFLALNTKLSKLFPHEKLPPFPPKRLIGNNFDPKFIQFRREKLHDYIQGVLVHPKIRSSESVREFLTTDSTDTGPTSRDVAGGKAKTSLDDFTMLKVIGKGSFGKVMLVQHKKDGKLYAMKVLSKKKVKQNDEVEHIKSERQVLMQNTNHPFLVGLHYSFQTLTKLYFVLDYIAGGELFFHLQAARRFPEPQALFYAAEILLALEYLHSLNIIYRDLKPENVLLDADGHASLTDFGLSKFVEKTTNTFCGTPEYLAPEVLRKQQYGVAVDWWCFGSVIYEILVGLPPFYCRDFNEMYRRILSQPVRFPPHVSENARDLIKKLLERDPKKRLGVGGANEIKSHPFFSSIDWEKLVKREITPPFIPTISGELGINNFDKQFVDEPIPKSIMEDDRIRVDVEIDETFPGFSYSEEEAFAEYEKEKEKQKDKEKEKLQGNSEQKDQNDH